MKIFRIYIFFLLISLPFTISFSQNTQQEKKERLIHYQPDGEDFLLVNGKRRFNRALYGGNSGFRAEAGDLPEFALYLPGMGGNLKFGLIKGDSSKWIIDAEKIQTRYRPGSMIYEIEDPFLNGGSVSITAITCYDKEGLLIKIENNRLPADVKLFIAFGGATGTRFSREGDIGADPESSFYLKPEYCVGNIYNIEKNNFILYYGSKSLSEEERYEIQYKPRTDTSKLPTSLKVISGVFPPFSELNIADANNQSSPLQITQSKNSLTPLITTQFSLPAEAIYFFIQNGKSETEIKYSELSKMFDKAESDRKKLAGRIKIHTPDPYINTLGGALAIAADAVWEHPSYMHGAVAWRMRLPGWRGAYLADVLGWHERARTHFSSYALSQVTSPLTGPVVMDTALHLARHAEKMGTSVFSSGYISRNPGGDKRPHHYDMNLVFIDQLLNHFLWTGDTAYAKSMWPLLKRHLEWENRNFDVDGDNLYDAYAAIWASDALQYSGGGVTHSTAYNYKAFKLAAEMAVLAGEDGEPYKKKAIAIADAVNKKLWMPSKGVYAEYKDLLGNQLLHSSPALWTIYHAIDSYLPDPFQSYQELRYIDNYIPKIPVRAKGLDDTTLYTISTTNWQPYTWSLNNVVLGEVMHTALAYWQGGRSEEAYKIWYGSLIESMYLGASPGNFQQLSFYDAIRGELYRDFADDIGMTARSLVEGLFGIFVDAFHDTIHITPGFPADWKHALLKTPDIEFSFAYKNYIDTYTLTSHLAKPLHAVLKIRALGSVVKYVLVNGHQVKWIFDSTAIGEAKLIIHLPKNKEWKVEIKWDGCGFRNFGIVKKQIAKGEHILIVPENATILEAYDPQHILVDPKISDGYYFHAFVNDNKGHKTIFLRIRQCNVSYWQPINFEVVNPVTIGTKNNNGTPELFVNNNTSVKTHGKLFVNDIFYYDLNIYQNFSFQGIIPPKKLVAGSNKIRYEWKGGTSTGNLINWDISNPSYWLYEKVDLSSYFNDQVNNIFKNQYLSPRPVGPTLQLPTQGIGNWAYPLVMPDINDSGLRAKAGIKNEYVIKQGIPFATPSKKGAKNILFASMWDNYPDSVEIKLSGKASQAYFLMAGSTNPMQSRIVNGEILIHYKDGTSEKLELKNPENWWPIEQDYFEDGLAFTTNAAKPVRVYFKTGEDSRKFNRFTSIRGFSSRGIDGGAGTILDLPLDPNKELRSMTLKAIANDVVIGLMSLTLVR